MQPDKGAVSDYTAWRKSLFEGDSLEDIEEAANKLREDRSPHKDPEVLFTAYEAAVEMLFITARSGDVEATQGAMDRKDEIRQELIGEIRHMESMIERLEEDAADHAIERDLNE